MPSYTLRIPFLRKRGKWILGTMSGLCLLRYGAEPGQEAGSPPSSLGALPPSYSRSKAELS